MTLSLVKHRRSIAIACILMALSFVAVFIKLRLRDPVYEGRRLSEWVALGGFNGGGLVLHGSEMPPDPRIGNAPSDPQAMQAISKLGPQAFPLLVGMLGGQEWFFERPLRTLAIKYPFLTKFLRPYNLVFARQVGAVGAFSLLGSRGTPALPDILPMLRDPDRAMAAMYAVMYINPSREEDVLSLTNVLRIQKGPPSSPAPVLHTTALLILGKFGSRAAGAVPVLTGCLTSTNEMIQGAAAVALARIEAPSEKVISLMIANLPTSPPTRLRPGNIAYAAQFETRNTARMTVWALGHSGAHARGALPILSRLQDHPYSNLAEAARASAASIRGETNHPPEIGLRAF